MNKCTLTTILLAIMLYAANAQAQNAGSVTFVSGAVTAERQPAEPLARGDDVFASDAVVTGPSSRAQLEMIDGAKIAIRPDSRIVIDEYRYAAAAPAGSPVATSGDSSVISLVKGGLRSVTGAIGKDDPQNVEVRTAVGVLGIRGTDFAVLLCGNCNQAPGVPPGTTVPQGLYIMVSDGIVVFQNEVASLQVTAGQFAFIPLTSRVPTRLDVAPPVFVDPSDFRFDAGSDSASQPSGFDSKLGLRREAEPVAPPPGSRTPGSDSHEGRSPGEAPAQPIIGTDENGNPIDLTPGSAQDPGNRSITWSTGPAGAFDATFSGVLDNSATQTRVDTNGNLTAFDNVYPAGNGTDIASFEIGSATNVDTGMNSMTVLRWGRWANGSASVTLSDGSGVNQDLGNQSLHWVAGENRMTAVVLPVNGIADYSLLGATSPTDSLGNSGVLGDASFQADFTNQRVTSTLNININGSNWAANGVGTLDTSALFQGIYDSVSIDGIGGGSGDFSGFFSTPGTTSDPVFPGGAGLTYSLQDNNGSVSVSGAAAFGNP